MELIVLGIIAGIVATSGMTFVMWWIDESGFAKADMIRGLGSFLTKSYEQALLPGTIIHFMAGKIYSK